MDEPFKGTNVKDALDASLAILERLATKADCLFLVSSHLIELRERFGERWFQSPDAGSWLCGLWRAGQRLRGEELLATVGPVELSLAALSDELA